MMNTVAIPTKLSGCSDQEWQTRVDLAALYRLFVHYGWTDLTYTHISARVPEKPEHYLINPYGLLFDEISASNLLKADHAGNVISGDYPYNEAGHLIHTAVLKARPEINFVLHSHTRAGYRSFGHAVRPAAAVATRQYRARHADLPPLCADHRG